MSKFSLEQQSVLFYITTKKDVVSEYLLVCIIFFHGFHTLSTAIKINNWSTLYPLPTLVSY